MHRKRNQLSCAFCFYIIITNPALPAAPTFRTLQNYHLLKMRVLPFTNPAENIKLFLILQRGINN